MRPEDLARAEALFHEALQLAPEARASFVESASADEGLRAHVLELLDAFEHGADYFSRLSGEIAAASQAEIDQAAHVGHRIGPYRASHVLGRGGMGTVFLAERADGHFDQQVAVKLLPLGIDDEPAVRRFVTERQIVARLQHPNIARLLDGGVTEEGRPYFVMEYVRGRPLLEYCAARELPVDDRLDLFLTIGEAVQYAHRNLVVHRDIKPANILVTDEGTVKLVDFGIAKLLAGELDANGDSPVTRPGERLLTPSYAAPEQLLGLPITTATDVYGMGVVLYELLTGRRLRGASAADARALERAILEEDSPRPSTVVADPQLRRKLRGDLDTICLKALRREPERRYQSAEQLVEDIRRHRGGLPVLARPDTLAYRTGKFVRRHRLGVGVAAAALVVSIGFAIAMALQSARLARERDKAEQVASVLVDLFEVSDPGAVRGGELTAREVLDRAATRIDSELEGQAELQASLLDVIGRVYLNLGQYDRAKPLLQRALALRRDALQENHPDVLASLSTLGEGMRLAGSYPAAEAALREALQRGRRRESLETARTLNNLAKVLYARGRYDDAEAAAREAVAMTGRFGADHVEAAEGSNNLAAALFAKGKYGEAEPFFRATVAARRRLLGDDHPLVAAALNNLASLLGLTGNYGGAEAAYRDALGIYQRILGPDDPRVATTLNNLALVTRARGDLRQAETLLRESLAIRRTRLAPEHPDLAQALSNLGLVLQELGALAEAESFYREALAIRTRALGSDHPRVAQSINNLGLLFQLQGRTKEADALLRQSLSLLERALGGSHPLVATAHDNLAALLHQNGALEEAEQHYLQALAIRRKVLPAGHPDLAHALAGLGRVLSDRKAFNRSRRALSEALDILERAFPDGHSDLDATRRALARLDELGVAASPTAPERPTS